MLFFFALLFNVSPKICYWKNFFIKSFLILNKAAICAQDICESDKYGK